MLDNGDSTLIITPSNKTILIDGGGSTYGDYDVGKNTLFPYLLDRGIKKIDYVMISHFDADHCLGLFEILKQLEIKQVIISKQGENSENFEKFIEIVKDRKIKLIVVKSGDELIIEKDIKIQILWPEEKQIKENVLNNNSIVCKLFYRNFSMLFTGDIEEVAEKQIISQYKNSKVLNSTVLKVAHHGSKTSSIQEFLEVVQPKASLIGVGKNNKFGHPNKDVIDRLQNLRCKSL